MSAIEFAIGSREAHYQSMQRVIEADRWREVSLTYTPALLDSVIHTVASSLDAVTNGKPHPPDHDFVTPWRECLTQNVGADVASHPETKGRLRCNLYRLDSTHLIYQERHDLPRRLSLINIDAKELDYRVCSQDVS